MSEKIRAPPETIRQIAEFLLATASVGHATPLPAPVEIRDPDDAVILSEVLASGAEILVSGDRDLLEADPVPGLRVLNPRDFWQLVRREGR